MIVPRSAVGQGRRDMLAEEAGDVLPAGARLSSRVEGISISTMGALDQPKARASEKARPCRRGLGAMMTPAVSASPASGRQVKRAVPKSHVHPEGARSACGNGRSVTEVGRQDAGIDQPLKNSS